MSLIYIRVPNPSAAERFSHTVSGLSRSASFYKAAGNKPPYAFGWVLSHDGLVSATHLEVMASQRLLFHPATDPTRLRCLVNDLFLRELDACRRGLRGDVALALPPDPLPPLFLEKGYFKAHRGNTVPVSDLFAPFMLDMAVKRREDLGEYRYHPGATHTDEEGAANA